MSLSIKLLNGFRYFLEMRAVGGFDEHSIARTDELRQFGEQLGTIAEIDAGLPRTFGNVLCQLALRDQKIDAVRRSTSRRSSVRNPDM